MVALPDYLIVFATLLVMFNLGVAVSNISLKYAKFIAVIIALSVGVIFLYQAFAIDSVVLGISSIITLVAAVVFVYLAVNDLKQKDQDLIKTSKLE